jgi:hypothetical protein
MSSKRFRVSLSDPLLCTYEHVYHCNILFSEHPVLDSEEQPAKKRRPSALVTEISTPEYKDGADPRINSGSCPPSSLGFEIVPAPECSEHIGMAPSQAQHAETSECLFDWSPVKA